MHPQSVIHGIVYYRDGSMLAQLGSPDMRIPIAHALGWPERMATTSPRLDLAALAGLEFRAARMRCGSRRSGWRVRRWRRGRHARHP